jgi:Cu-Zn family superoxide dismutase
MSRNPTRPVARVAAATAIVLSSACSDTPMTSVPPSFNASRATSGSLPEQYVLPGAAVFPEGIAVDQRAGTVFVSSTTDGTIFRGTLGDANLTPFLPGGADGRTSATGLAVDDKGRLYVAGAGTGDVFIYDDASGALLAHLSTGSSPTFINDIVIAPDGSAYVTDSQSPFIYRITQNGAGQFALERWLDLTGTVFEYQAGFNANGIEITPNGKYLIVVQSNTGELFRIEIASREVTEFNIDAPLLNADGILLQGNTLYVLQNAQGLLTEIRLDVNHLNGTTVGSRTDPSFAFPTSLELARGRLLVVNSQFNKRGPGLTPTLPFTVSVVKP